jgi:NTE family protein
MAHLGVLTVLEREGIPIDYVAGTSAGSLIGAMYCAGIGLEKIKEYATSLHWWNIAWPVWHRQGIVSFARLENWLVQKLGDISFEELQTPFAAVAADLDTGEGVKLDRGRLAPAVRASCSVPGLVTPIVLEGRMLGDGSLADTVPVDILKEMGADYVIGVDIFAASIRPRLGPIAMAINAIEILIQRAGGGIKDADCLISPALGGQTYFRFSKREQFHLLGEQAALEKIPHLRRELSLDQAVESVDANPQLK